VQLVLDDARPPIPFTMLHFADLSAWNGDAAAPAWRQLEEGVKAVARDGWPAHAFDDFASGRPSLSRAAPVTAVLGRVVRVGDGSIGLVGLTAAGTLLATSGQLHASAFGAATMAAFALSCFSLGLVCMKLVQTAIASRRS